MEPITVLGAQGVTWTEKQNARAIALENLMSKQRGQKRLPPARRDIGANNLFGDRSAVDFLTKSSSLLLMRS